MPARLWLLLSTLLSHYRQHPAQAVFLLAGLSLGVAMLLATLIVSAAAERAFDEAQTTIGGQVVARIVPMDSRPTLPESLYRQLKREGVDHIFPVAEGHVKTPSGLLAIYGTDIFPLLNQSSRQLNAERLGANLQALNAALNERGTAPSTDALMRFSFPPYLTLVATSYAKLHGLSEGVAITLEGGEALPPVRIVDDAFGLGYHLFCDLRCAQVALGMTRSLSSVIVTELSPPTATRIKEIIATRAELVVADKNLKNPAFTDAFLLNLKGIGLLAFLVGCFLAFNAVRFSVLQRTPTVKRLRLAGATVNEVLSALFFELLLWSLAAAALGCVIGFGMAKLLLPSIGLTLDRLFFFENVLFIGAMHHWWPMALLVSLMATGAATALPFWQLSRQAPLQNPLSDNFHKSTPSAASLLTGLALLLSSGLLLMLPKTQTNGLAITALWFLAGACLVPVLQTQVFTVLSRRKFFLSYPSLHWMLADARFEQQRASVAMMAYTIAIAACIAVVIMVSSFRQAFAQYLELTLSESIYLNLDPQQLHPVERWLSEQPEIVHHYRFYQDKALAENKLSVVTGLSDHPRRQNSLTLERSVDRPWQAFFRREGVFINQALALTQQLKAGDPIALVIDGNSINTQVLGVYLSYGSLAPGFMIEQNWLLALWPQLFSTRIGVFTKVGGSGETVLARLVAQYALDSQHYIEPQALKALALRVFARTFLATHLLGSVILLIACGGIFCTCYINRLDKSRQLALVRVLGLSAGKVHALSVLQVLCNTLLAALVALPLGVLTAWASIHIVLRYSFGWYFNVLLEPNEIAAVLGISLSLALLGASLPHYLMRQQYSLHRMVSQG